MSDFNVLVVDDEVDVFTVTKMVYEFGYKGLEDINVHYASSGKEGIDILSSRDDIGMVLLDIVMESENAGFEVLEYIRNIKKDDKLSVIIRSGHPGSIPTEYMHLMGGVNGYLNKVEVESSTLLNVLNRALGH